MESGNKKKSFKWAKFSLIVVIVILLIGGVYNYLRPIPKLTPVYTLGSVQPSSVTPIWPDLGTAQAAIGAVGYGLVANSGTQVEKPTASTAKLITALMILKKYPLVLGQTTSPTITFSASDVALYQQYLNEQGSVVRVQAGEQISEYQALEAMLLPSANNIADSMAIWAYGSLADYTAAANNYLPSLGLKKTVVGVDASGFLPSTISTASDLVSLGLDAMANPVITQIVAEKQADIPLVGTVYNVNLLLQRNDVIGIKTGNSDQAGGVYIFAVKDPVDQSHNVTIVGAVEGTPDLSLSFSLGVQLISFAESNFALNPVVHSSQAVGYYRVPWEKQKVSALASSAMSSVTWSTSMINPKLQLNKATAPLRSGQIVGSITVWHTSMNHDSDNLIIERAIPAPPWWWRIARFTL